MAPFMCLIFYKECSDNVDISSIQSNKFLEAFHFNIYNHVHFEINKSLS